MLKMRKVAVATALALAAASLSPGAAMAEDIHVIATGALQGAMQKIKPAYEKKTGNRLVISWGPSFGPSSESIPSRLRNSEPMDVTIITDDALERLSSDVAFDKTSRRIIAESRIGVGVPAGKPRPDITSVETFRAALIASPRIAYSQGASGVYIRDTLLPKLGLAQQMEGKTVIAEGGELVGTLLARGEADIGMQQVSELKVTPGVDFIGPLPEALQKVSRFAAIAAGKTAHRAAARSFIAFLVSPQAQPLLRESGLDSVKPSAR